MLTRPSPPFPWPSVRLWASVRTPFSSSPPFRMRASKGGESTPSGEGSSLPTSRVLLEEQSDGQTMLLAKTWRCPARRSGGKGMQRGTAVKSTHDDVRSVRAASACLAGPAWCAGDVFVALHNMAFAHTRVRAACWTMRWRKQRGASRLGCLWVGAGREGERAEGVSILRSARVETRAGRGRARDHRWACPTT